MRKFILLIALAFIFDEVNAQLEKPVTWSYFAKKTGKNEAILNIKAKMKGNWHIYSLNVKGIPAKTYFTFSSSKDYTLVGKTQEPKPISKYDKVIKANLTYFEKEVVFTQKIKLNKPLTFVKGKVEFMVCNEKSCLPSDEVLFSIPVK
jgi:hypothetical protein